jgi:hypothetical protein
MYLVVKDINLNFNQSNFPILRDKTLLHIYTLFNKILDGKFGENIKNSYYRNAELQKPTRNG